MKFPLKCYSIVVTVLLAVVLCKSDFLQKIGYRVGIITPWPHYHKMMTYHNWMDPVIPEGSVLFIGDSLTQSLPVSAIVPNGINLGIGGDTTVGVLERLGQYRSIERASTVVLLIGVNDLPWRDNESILQSMEAILKAIAVGPEIILCSILPVRDSGAGIGFEQATRRIQVINAGLQGLASQHVRVEFIDLYTHLSDSSGQLAIDFDSGDGLHLNSAGYQCLIQLLAEARWRDANGIRVSREFS